MIFPLQITTDPSLDPNRQYKLDHAGKIDKQAFNVLVVFFTALSILAAISRIVFRLKNYRKLHLDDWLVLFATGCLVSAAGVLFSYRPKLYLTEAYMRGLDVAFTVQEIASLADDTKWNEIYLCLAWTANFAVKFSFLAFFHTLIRDVSRKLLRYFWFVVVYTGLSWVFVIVEPFVLCVKAHGPWSSASCPSQTLEEFFPALIFLFDITTDITIASIPIILLRMSHLRSAQKIRIGTFLCLSLVIVVVSLTRLIGGLYHSRRGKYEFSMQWCFTMLHIEASIAVLMGSISALRTVFAAQSNAKAGEDKGTIVFLHHKVVCTTDTWKKLFGGYRSDERNNPQLSNENMTQPTLKSLRTFIRRCDRSPGHTTLASSMSDTEDYHVFMRTEQSVNYATSEVRLPAAAMLAPPNSTPENMDEHDPWITKPESLSRAV